MNYVFGMTTSTPIDVLFPLSIAYYFPILCSDHWGCPPTLCDFPRVLAVCRLRLLGTDDHRRHTRYLLAQLSEHVSRPSELPMVVNGTCW